MMKLRAHNKCAVTAFSVLLSLAALAGGRGAALAQEAAPRNEAPQIEVEAENPASDAGDLANQGSLSARMERWFAELADPDYAGWARAQTDIEREWSKSGSAAMDLLLMRGELSLDEGDLAGAIDDLTALTDHAPEFPAGFAARGVAFYMAGEHGPALADLAQAVALEPRQFAALAVIGQIFEEMRQDARAIAAYEASLALNPHQADVSDAIARLKKTQEGIAL
ncbi:hypothetical protein [Albirhodobacter sp. R86504]|uniref:hypothetical protein n=1 Tax=Albirhodobacter sp. R86504 TaxID=3093848 RepID=UPI00366FD898